MIGSHGFCSADLHLYDFCLHFPCSKFCNLSHGFKTYGIDNHTCPWILLPDDMQNIRKASTASPNKYMCRRFQGFQYFRCFPIHRNHICQMKFFQIPAQKLLGICHLISGAFLVAAASQTAYAPLYSCMLLSVMFYMPTIALSNSVAYNALDLAKLDTVKHFPPIRVWGTVGFIAAMWFVDLTHIGGIQIKLTAWQLYVSAFLSFVLAVYSFSLPGCPVDRNVKSQSWIDTLGLRAFALFKEKRMAVFFIFSMLLGAALQITNAFGDTYIQNFGSMPQYADSAIVKHSVILLSLSQMSETFCILLIPFFLRRFGIKKVMLISMLAWVLRFGFFGIGNPGSGAAFLILSMVVYGVAFDFFNISGSLFVEKETSREIRSSAQGVFMIMTNGFGAFFGSYAAGAVVDAWGWPDSWYIFAGYALVVAVVFALVFKYKHNPAEMASVKH